MQQKDEEIQKYSSQMEHYKLLCEKYHHDLHSQADTLNKLSAENNQLISQCKAIAADRSKLYNESQQKQAALQAECSRLEKERADFEKDIFELRNILKELDYHVADKHKKMEQLESNLMNEHQKFMKQSTHNKQLEEDISLLKQQNDTLIKEDDLKFR